MGPKLPIPNLRSLYYHPADGQVGRGLRTVRIGWLGKQYSEKPTKKFRSDDTIRYRSLRIGPPGWVYFPVGNHTSSVTVGKSSQFPGSKEKLPSPPSGRTKPVHDDSVEISEIPEWFLRKLLGWTTSLRFLAIETSACPATASVYFEGRLIVILTLLPAVRQTVLGCTWPFTYLLVTSAAHSHIRLVSFFVINHIVLRILSSARQVNTTCRQTDLGAIIQKSDFKLLLSLNLQARHTRENLCLGGNFPSTSKKVQIFLPERDFRAFPHSRVGK